MERNAVMTKVAMDRREDLIGITIKEIPDLRAEEFAHLNRIKKVTERGALMEIADNIERTLKFLVLEYGEGNGSPVVMWAANGYPDWLTIRRFVNSDMIKVIIVREVECLSGAEIITIMENFGAQAIFMDNIRGTARENVTDIGIPVYVRKAITYECRDEQSGEVVDCDCREGNVRRYKMFAGEFYQAES